MNNSIHPSAIIDSNVIFGSNNKILANTIIYGPTRIGSNNIIGPNVIIGTPGQDTRNPYYDSSNCEIEIGNNNIIREFTAIQKPCYKNITRLGNNIFLMQSVHIPHDAIIQDYVNIAPMTVLAGITTILKCASIGMGVTINQYSVIGQYSMLAMGSAVVKNVKPFSIYIPNNLLKVNEYAIKKFGLEDYHQEISNYVIHNVDPVSQPIQEIVAEFEMLHIGSKRKLYK
jgi:UDP-N-acetylglucosamine acyltransferase